MTKLINKALLLSVISVFSTASMAANDWQFELTPYLFATGVEASVPYSGAEPSEPSDDDYDFFLLDNLDGYAAATFLARQDRLSLYVDGFYARFSDTIKRPISGTEMDMKLGFVEGSVGYQILTDKDISLVVGVRNIYIDTTLDINASIGRKNVSNSFSLDRSWTDPLIGIQANFPINNNWSWSYRGDIGGGNDTDYVVQSLINVNYQMTEHTSLKMGYRYMKAELKRNPLLENITLSGLQIGLGIQF